MINHNFNKYPYQEMLQFPQVSGIPILQSVASGVETVVWMSYNYPYDTGIVHQSEDESIQSIIKAENTDNQN